MSLSDVIQKDRNELTTLFEPSKALNYTDPVPIVLGLLVVHAVMAFE